MTANGGGESVARSSPVGPSGSQDLAFPATLRPEAAATGPRTLARPRLAAPVPANEVDQYLRGLEEPKRSTLQTLRHSKRPLRLTSSGSFSTCSRSRRTPGCSPSFSEPTPQRAQTLLYAGIF